MLQTLLAIYRALVGTPVDPDAPLLETLSSLELMHFLLAVEREVPSADIGEIDHTVLTSLHCFAGFLAGRTR